MFHTSIATCIRKRTFVHTNVPISQKQQQSQYLPCCSSLETIFINTVISAFYTRCFATYPVDNQQLGILRFYKIKPHFTTFETVKLFLYK